MRSDRYQTALIALGIVATAGFGVFFYRELFPEYKIYQNDYVALEEFRSSYTGEHPPVFQEGIKQIVIEREDKGPAMIDRCISCHVALQFPHFSPTKIARDEKGHILYGRDGAPQQEPNEEYIWLRLDQRIEELLDEKALENLRAEGKSAKADQRIQEAEKLKALKVREVSGHTYDMKKVLTMHPLMGNETRPFEYHPIESYGCTSCHNGNGRGLTTEKAHGPVFDGDYEKEFIGYVPQFLESDSANDPAFSRVFNGKPGHELLFQTSPIYVGALIQSKCMQCHAETSSLSLEKAVSKHVEDVETSFSKTLSDTSAISEIASEVDLLTYNYHRGQELYITQACYACHRIAGFSRGGVGPELTQEGYAYPWYIKQKIVWPQSDLKTSTMPNMHMDHEEIEDLMTFVLGQMGKNNAVSPMAYKIAVQRWEEGKKMAWEKPITSEQMLDLRYSMSVFAEDGCAACHRLEGFKSDVGYAAEINQSEKNKNALLLEKKWFKELFKEDMTGSEIVQRLDDHADEIDQKIVPGVRENSILEEIEAKKPRLIESFYSPFKYAKRAKNTAYKNDPDKLEKWKDRVHRVLMMFIQEYGLGRLIGPRPNWSGVYHTDEWLMEHFRNPSSHVARSIMPVLPFDDTKFYALTHMLDVLGIQNRDSVHEIWNRQGFSPEEAFQIHCAQCHGEFKLGNGPIAEWIYPIPKNLNDPTFLKNLTKKNAIESITHGVKGTPMPPWGEAAQKPGVDGIAVLSSEEIKGIVDWLYSSIPGAEESDNSRSTVAKWKYQVEDVVNDLEKEGSEFLKAKDDHHFQKSGYDYFDVLPDEVQGKKSSLYYIKKKYYTAENIGKGKAFFEMNCAVCHGKEADGTGIRAATMFDAKPRMLTNLDWINTRDDLRLLRSIKYGVPGTSMTPWGDATSSLQRMQLVIFIRSLTEDSQVRAHLSEAIYQAFDEGDFEIEQARSLVRPLLSELKGRLDEMSLKRKALEKQVKEGEALPKEAVDLYQKEQALIQEIKKREALDKLYQEMRDNQKKEKEIYDGMGKALIQSRYQEESLPLLLKALNLFNGSYRMADEKLVYTFDDEKFDQLRAIEQDTLSLNEGKIAVLKSQKEIAEGKIDSLPRREKLTQLEAEILTLEKLNVLVSSGFEKSLQIRHRQAALYEQLSK